MKTMLEKRQVNIYNQCNRKGTGKCTVRYYVKVGVINKTLAKTKRSHAFVFVPYEKNISTNQLKQTVL